MNNLLFFTKFFNLPEVTSCSLAIFVILVIPFLICSSQIFNSSIILNVAMAVEMLIHAYALVRYGKAIPSDNIKSGRSEFFLADAVRMHSMTALAYKKAKHLNYDAYKIGRHALKYIHDAGLKFPHDMKRNLGYMALRVLENEGFK